MNVEKGYRIRVSLAALNTKVQENVSGVQTVKALSQEDEESKRFDSKNEDYRMKHIDIAKVYSNRQVSIHSCSDMKHDSFFRKLGN